MKSIGFFVPGIPAPGGSKRFVGFGKKTGRAILIDDAGQRNTDWKSIVAMFAKRAMEGSAPIRDIGLNVKMTFYVPRPKGHYKTGKNADVLRDNAPTFPLKKPDVLKLARSTEDAMTGIVWDDDSSSVTLTLRKRFSITGCGADILIRQEIFQ